jgi:ubiquinone/menaquinone biosynthesis C-methylase UbiE
MARIEAFEKYSKEYDDWFTRNKNIFLSELNAIKSFIPDGKKGKKGVEIGVGSGRFALPLKIKIGVEPSRKMADISRSRGIQVCEAVAEQLPFGNEIFDFVLMVTTICFVDNPVKSFKEAYRVLKPAGFIVVGFIDKNSELGRQYQLKKKTSKFYREATFYSVGEVIDFLREAHFEEVATKQTVFSDEPDAINPVENGWGRGSFVVIKANVGRRR